MDLKKPLNYSKQIDKLISHGIIISDKENAEKIISQINYYRFTGYALQFRENPSSSKYIENISFDQIYKIYQFDELIRNICREFIEKVEIYYRTKISYGFSLCKCSEAPHDQHYCRDNYYNKDGFDEIIESFNKQEKYYKDSLIVKHHIEKYSNKMPLWVMVELMSFSNLSKLYSSMYSSEQKQIATDAGTSVKTLINNLHCMSILRNKCAHAARLYNTEFNPPVKLSRNFLRKNSEVKNNLLFAYIIVLIKRIPEKNDKQIMVNKLEKTLHDYKDSIDLKLIGFPNNYLEILNTLIS